MPRVLNIKSYSFNVKIAISLFILAICLITVLFAIIVPKMQKEQYNAKIDEIEQVLSITQEQIHIAGKAIVSQSRLEIQANKNLLELQLANIKNQIDETMDLEKIKEKIENSSIPKFASYAIKLSDDTYISDKENIYKKHKIKEYEKWEKYYTQIVSKDYNYMQKYLFYTKKITVDIEISIFSIEDKLNPNHFPFEDTLKENIQNTFNLNQNLHKGKTYMFWLNSKYKDEDDKPLYVEDKNKSKEKYNLSKMSDVSNIYTGDLTAKQIMEARDKKFVEHSLDGKEAISWVVDVYRAEDDGYTFLLVKTIYKEDLNKHIDSALLKVLPAALVSLLLALFIGFFLFRNLFKRINILANTAKEVVSGNIRTRSEVRGNDDVGLLGVAFDSMLDSLQDNIKTLDLKVEEKTKRLQYSLEEKELLLKEIHHRVKNNLALTISLIKLQQEEIKEEKAKKTLVDIQERIYTMEILHRKLYESANLNEIDFKDYVVNLVDNISRTYKYKDSVKIKVKIEDIFLGIETAMSYGLILNEIITNAFKYAFIDNKNPKLLISMKIKDDNYILVVKDTGKGIDKNINVYDSSTLGLKLINSIAKLQLKGEIEYKYKKGSIFKVVIPC